MKNDLYQDRENYNKGYMSEEEVQKLCRHPKGGKMSSYNHKCLVHECKNRIWGGEFVGSLCKPCYLMIATGNDLPSTNFISKLFRERDQLREALECLVDWNPRVEYWERDETVSRFEADMAKARKILEETE